MPSTLTHPNILSAQQFASVRPDLCTSAVFRPSFGGVEKQQRRPQQNKRSSIIVAKQWNICARRCVAHICVHAVVCSHMCLYDLLDLCASMRLYVCVRVCVCVCACMCETVNADLFRPHRLKHLLQQDPHLLDVVHQHTGLERDG